MKTTFKPSDYSPVKPKSLSGEATSILASIRDMADETKKSKAWQEWRQRFFKEYAAIGDANASNYSNFVFLLGRRKQENAHAIDPVLNQYARINGFKRKLNDDQTIHYFCSVPEVFSVYNALEPEYA